MLSKQTGYSIRTEIIMEYRLELRNVSKSFVKSGTRKYNFQLGRNEIVGLLVIMGLANPP